MVIDATPRNAAHLWRRAAFGATPDEIARTVADGIEATVERMFDHRDAPAAGGPMRTRGEFAVDGMHLNLWFMRLAATSPTPAIERLTWFWHGHFATSYHKFEDAELLHHQLLMMRRHGLGRFDDLLKLMNRDAAMILWLDLEKSIVGNPNENYARELMELFALGVDGGYTQADVVEAGRAFTGYSVTEQRPHQGLLRSGLHDTGSKTILGQTGDFDGDDVVDLIVARPECHRFIATRMWTRYAGTTPVAGVIDELAAVFARDLRVKDLITAMLTHPAFYADEVHKALVTQPVETMIGAVRGFGIDLVDVRTSLPEEDDDDYLWFIPLELLGQMGQYVGEPPNVGGWPHNEPWLDATRSIGRFNAALAFANFVSEFPPAAMPAIREAADDNPGAAIAAIFAAFGVVEWSNDTATAMTAALTSRSEFPDPVTAAIAVAFTSPEVTLS